MTVKPASAIITASRRWSNMRRLRSGVRREDMPNITCFGAVNEIGGNKILLEDSGSSIMLDFGKSFSAENSFFDEFLQPRTNACLRDLLTLSLLPPIPGIYRHDMLRHAGAWESVCGQRLPAPVYHPRPRHHRNDPSFGLTLGLTRTVPDVIIFYRCVAESRTTRRGFQWTGQSG